MPFALLFSGVANAIGTFTLLPPLLRLDDQAKAIHADVHGIPEQIRLLGDEIADAIAELSPITALTYEINPQLLEDLSETRWGIARLDYNTMADVQITLWGMQAGQRRTNQLLEVIHMHMVDTTYELWLVQSRILAVCEEMLAELRRPRGPAGVLEVVFRFRLEEGDIDWGEVAKLLGALAVGLAIVAAFIAGVTLALAMFGVKALAGAAAVSAVLYFLRPLVELLAGMDWPDLAKLALGLTAVGGLVVALATSLRGFTLVAVLATAALAFLVDRLTGLVQAFAGMSVGQLVSAAAGLAALGWLMQRVADLAKLFAAMTAGEIVAVVAGFAAMAGFVWVLVQALKGLDAETLKASGELRTFIASLGELARSFAAMKAADLAAVVVGLAALAGFVWVLGQALAGFTPEVLAAMEPLAGFIGQLGELAGRFAEMNGMDLLGMAAGLALLAGFVWLLGQALGAMDETALAALPGMAQLIETLARLGAQFAAMSGPQLGMMALGLAVVAAFVWLLAGALVFAAGPLSVLSQLLERLQAIIDRVFASLQSAIAGVRQLAGMVPGLGSIGSLFSAAPGAGAPAGGAAASPTPTAMAVAPAAAALPAFPGPGTPPALAALAAAPAPGAGAVDRSVNVDGGINVAVNADRLEANAGQMLSEEIIRGIRERLDGLRSEQSFRTGERLEAPA